MGDADAKVTGAIQGIAAESGKATGSAMKGNGMGDEGGLTELYKVNQIWFRLPPSLSLVAKRTQIVNQFQKTSYNLSDQLTCIFNSGEYYASMSTGWFVFEVGWNTPASYAGVQALISQGNLATLIEEVVFMSASGTEVCREQNKGLKEAFTFRYCHNQEYINTYGQVQGAPMGSYSRIYDGVAPTFDYGFQPGVPVVAAGAAGTYLLPIAGTINTTDARVFNYGAPATALDVGAVTFPRSGTRAMEFYGYGLHNINTYDVKDATGATKNLGYATFLIPMNQILGLFNPYLAALTPAGLLAGGRLDIRLKNTQESIQFVSWAQTAASADAGTVAAVQHNPNLNQLITDYNKFTVNKVYCLLDAYQMQDSVLRRLNQIAAGQDGLSIMFDTYDYASAMFSGAGQVEAQVNQARSRIIRSFCIIRDTANIMNPYINSFSAEAAINRVAGLIGPGQTQIALVTPATTAGSLTPIGGVGGIQELLSIGTTAGAQVGNTSPSKPAAITIIPYLPADPSGSGSYNINFGAPIVSSYQAQLGSLFFPQQPLTTPQEQYANALYLWGVSMADKDKNCSVSYQDFLGGLGYGLYGLSTMGNLSTNGTPVNPYDYNPTNTATAPANNLGSVGYGKWVAPYGMAIYGMLAEKNQTLQLSGLPISNARLLRHRITFAIGPQSGTSRTIAVITYYTRVAKIFLGGRVVVRE